MGRHLFLEYRNYRSLHDFGRSSRGTLDLLTNFTLTTPMPSCVLVLHSLAMHATGAALKYLRISHNPFS